MSAESDRHIEAVIAALQIVECFQEDLGLRAAELQARTGFSYSRVMRLTGTLATRGFLTHDADSGRYFLGPSLFRIGKLLLPRYDDLAASIRPTLKEMVDQTAQTAMFSITDGVSRVVLCKEEPTSSLRYTIQEGQCRPIGAGASGRVLLAFASEKIRAQALAAVGDGCAELEARLADVRSRGDDVSISELTLGAFAVAAPVLAPEGQLIGVLSLAGPAGVLTDENRERYVALVRESAARIEVPRALSQQAAAE